MTRRASEEVVVGEMLRPGDSASADVHAFSGEVQKVGAPPRRKGGLAAATFVVLLFMSAMFYLSSSTFKAWVHHPLWMYSCKVEKQLPDALCLIGVALGEAGQMQRKERARSAVEPSAMPVKLEDVEGEWFSDYSGGRELRIRGGWRNTSYSDAFEDVRCEGSLHLTFAGDRTEVIKSSSLCGSRSTLSQGETASARGWSGITVEKKWLGYPITSARLRIEVSARAATGALFTSELIDTTVPLPSERESFFIGTKR
jgi:hypothetical protein